MTKEKPMFARQLQLFTLALVLGAVTAQGQGVAQKGGSVSLTPNAAGLVTTHDGLAAQFRRLTQAATGATAKASDRAALASFVRGKVVPQINQEVAVLFPVFDSIVGGGYAVPATLFDLDAVSYLVKELERTAANGDRTAFETRTFALGLSLETYFTKVQLLVLPVLNERLGEAASQRLEVERNP
jgi:hypothetical protein